MGGMGLLEPAQLAAAVREVTAGEVRVGEPMARYTSFRIGGPADVLVVPRDADDLQHLLSFLAERGIPHLVMGNGSNLLVLDSGVRGVVVKIGGGLDHISRVAGDEVRAGAGTSLPRLASWAASEGLSGLEFAAGIPGSVGGAVVMNAGAYGQAMQQVVRSVTVVAHAGARLHGMERRVIPGDLLQFAARGSRFTRTDEVIVEARLKLAPADPDEVKRRTDELLRTRRRKQPLSYPSAGCIFRNPEGEGAGRFIDWAGLRGLQVGGARVSEKHANFIVNLGGATAEDVLRLMDRVRSAVEERYGVRLEPEVRIVGK